MKQILVFVLMSALMCWFMFAPIYKHVLIMRQAILQKETDLLLERGASGLYGYIDSVMIADSRQRLAERGFDPMLVEYRVSSSTGSAASDPFRPVLRGTGIRLEIRYPYERLFLIDRLIGIEPPSPNGQMAAAGMKMSEYIP
jgi:hypothetical protein